MKIFLQWAKGYADDVCTKCDMHYIYLECGTSICKRICKNVPVLISIQKMFDDKQMWIMAIIRKVSYAILLVTDIVHTVHTFVCHCSSYCSALLIDITLLHKTSTHCNSVPICTIHLPSHIHVGSDLWQDFVNYMMEIRSLGTHRMFPVSFWCDKYTVV